MTADEMFISGKTNEQSIIEQPVIMSSDEEIYTDSDDVNPLHINYDSTNSPTVVDENEEIKTIKRSSSSKKSFLRDVRSSKRRESK